MSDPSPRLFAPSGEQPSDHLDATPDEQPVDHLTPSQTPNNGLAPHRPLHPVEVELDIRFRDASLLDRAFIHRSFLNELLDDNAELVDNERLEFLGDTVLGYLVSERLYHLFPAQQEGDLTNLRSALVRRETLARLANDLHLGTYLKLGHGEEESGGRTRPATLCAVFEALVGAVYLDQGTETAKQVIFHLLDADIKRLQATTHTKDPQEPAARVHPGARGHDPALPGSRGHRAGSRQAFYHDGAGQWPAARRRRRAQQAGSRAAGCRHGAAPGRTGSRRVRAQPELEQRYGFAPPVAAADDAQEMDHRLENGLSG